MKLIIDIPEVDYKLANHNYPLNMDEVTDMIQNGTPIPDNATNEIETIIRRYTDEQTN